MCGRFANHLADMERWGEVLQDWPCEGPQGFNLAPTMAVPLLTQQGCRVANWGLVPAWSKESKSSFATFNARLETVAEKPTFRGAWRAKRTCMVPMRGYYEWLVVEGEKQPYFVTHTNQPLWVAGLWEQREQATSFTILTKPACERLAPLHSRQPCLLLPEHVSRWLAGELSLVGGEADTAEWYAGLDYFAVSPEVNRVRSEGKQLIAPFESGPLPKSPEQATLMFNTKEDGEG